MPETNQIPVASFPYYYSLTVLGVDKGPNESLRTLKMMRDGYVANMTIPRGPLLLNFAKPQATQSQFVVEENAQLQDYHLLLKGAANLGPNDASHTLIKKGAKLGMLLVETSDGNDFLQIDPNVQAQGIYVRSFGGNDAVFIGPNLMIGPPKKALKPMTPKEFALMDANTQQFYNFMKWRETTEMGTLFADALGKITIFGGTGTNSFYLGGGCPALVRTLNE